MTCSPRPLSHATPLPSPNRSAATASASPPSCCIVTVVGFAIPFVNYAAIATGAIGIVFAILGLVAKGRPRGTSIAGLVLSGIGLILSIVMVVVYSAIFFGVSKAVDDSNKPPPR